MKILKQILICLVIAMLSYSVTIYAQSEEEGGDDNCIDADTSFALAAEDEDVRNEFASMGYLCAKRLYHKEMNEFFNKKIEILLSLLKESDFEKYPAFQVPADISVENYKELCAQDNVSSYCVSMQALDIYMGYTEVLESVKSYLPFELPGEDDATVGELLNESSRRSVAMTKEFEDAQKVMEATISAYNEFKLAYPMHTKFEQIIKDLVKYKMKLRGIHREVIEFPIKFVDATSTSCK